MLPPLFAYDQRASTGLLHRDSLSHLHNTTAGLTTIPRQPSAATTPGFMDSTFQDSPTIGRTVLYTANRPLPPPANAAASRYAFRPSFFRLPPALRC